MQADAHDDDELWAPIPPPPPPPHAADEDDDNDDDGPAEIIGDGERNEDGVWEVGMAEAPSRSLEDADLVLFLECSETIDCHPDHPILQPGETVAIGLEKTTKLSEVFRRYCAFCNEKSSPSSCRVQRADLEFFHCSLLNEHDTAETAALMKNDRVQVRKVRADERRAEMEQKRFKRESDREYFRKLRQLLPDVVGAKSCDVLFDCQGKLTDENGLNQQVLRTYVQGHSAILSKRCPWLGVIIQIVRDENGRRSVVTIPDNEGGADGGEEESPVAAVQRDEEGVETIPPKPQDEDDGIEALHYPIDQPRLEPGKMVVNDDDAHESNAAEIENSEDEDNGFSLPRRQGADGDADRVSSPVISSTSGSSNMLWVTLADHPPEAVKLLLEYCYTNRVLALGYEAFVVASRTNPLSSSLNGNVMPFIGTSRRWPNNGLPLVSFSVALSGLALAEEASMPRLALMCEVAASQLVKTSNFVEALDMCSTQERLTGNGLTRLRAAAMDVLLRRGERGVVDVCRLPTFQKALLERSSTVVPSLLSGTRDAVAPKKASTPLSGSKRHWSEVSSTRRCFEQMDKEDSYKRELERRKRRKERRKDRGQDSDEDDYSVATSKKSLKRMYPQSLLGKRGASRVAASKFSSRRRNARKRGA